MESLSDILKRRSGSGRCLAFSIRRGRARAHGGLSVGVFGWATNGPLSAGVYGRADGTNSAGVTGLASFTSGLNYGMRGESASAGGIGMYGFNGGGTASYVPAGLSTESLRPEPFFYQSFVVPDGRVVFAGGEYGTGVNDVEVYDPVANTWTLPVPSPTPSISDADISFGFPEQWFGSWERYELF